ncbi:hypothetical protein Lfu02_14850 [Longispora fulva]|uniref:DUF8175 domain-containing protein n=1 Tax=Longispora fulva TaxID=619741 RepID=A0A8J7KJK3_9ACTN|nr:hypothetical protein [Longispora fulva]MBG6140505.1 hypothetical protein [Longispora fulva]GIG57113.1 hypothetical protein Lfu02_14850 [Longispora fulva]
MNSASRKVLLFGGVAVLVLGCVGLALYAPNRTATPNGSPAPTGAATMSASPAPAVTAATVDLSDVRWTDMHGVALPVSAKSGPGNERDGRALGFAHTPTGALLAGVHIMARCVATAGPEIYRPTINDQVTGVDQAALLAATEQTTTTGAAAATLTGYRVETYTPETAYLRLLLTGPARAGTPALVDFRLQVQWINNDWRLVAPPNGLWETAAASVTSAAGYTTFPPRR